MYPSSTAKLCVVEATAALARLCGCTDLFESQLVTDVKHHFHSTLNCDNWTKIFEVTLKSSMRNQSCP